MQQIKTPPAKDTIVHRSLASYWWKHWELYTHYRGERIGKYRPWYGNISLPVWVDAVMAFRLGNGDYLAFGRFVFGA